MAHHVPDFEMDHSSPTRGNKNTLVGDEDVMELLWQNGQVVAHTQNHRLFKKVTNGAAGDDEFPPPPQSFTSGREIPLVDAETLSRQPNQNQNQNQNQHQELFIQEDEMASWLQYPLEDYSLDREIYSDIFYPPISAPPTPQRDVRSSLMEVRRQPLLPPPVTVSPSTFIAPRPPIAHPPRCADVQIPASNFHNFLNFSIIPRARWVESAPSTSSKAAGEFTMAESNETPLTAGQNSKFSLTIGSSAQASNGNIEITAPMSTSTGGRGFATTCDLTVTESPGGSGASVSASVEATPAIHKPALRTVEEKKRKEREPDIDVECHSEEQDEEFVSTEVKKQSHKSTIKRSRASEVHNLSERKRRDRINDRMRALQELIPRCNKVDKASMLDEAIEYLKSLQMQVQMMSMGCGMVPMMYPGAQQYMGMGAIGMGMGMGMNHPMMTYPAQFSGSGFPLQAAAANLASTFPMPAFQMQQIPLPDTARNPTSIQQYPMSTPMMDPYQHLVGFQQAHVPVQSQVGVHHCNKPSSSRDSGNPKNEKAG